jgi:heat shock protein HslJ
MGLEGHWIIESMLVDGELATPIEGIEITLDVEGDRVSGGAMNRFMGGLGADTLLGMMAATRMVGLPEIMSQEQVFLSHIQSVDSYEADRRNLTVDGEVVPVLCRAGSGKPLEEE